MRTRRGNNSNILQQEDIAGRHAFFQKRKSRACTEAASGRGEHRPQAHDGPRAERHRDAAAVHPHNGDLRNKKNIFLSSIS